MIMIDGGSRQVWVACSQSANSRDEQTWSHSGALCHRFAARWHVAFYLPMCCVGYSLL